MILRCRAPRRRATKDGQTCGGFVAQLPSQAIVVALLRHSKEADPEHHVSPCRTCGQLHEYKMDGEVAAERRSA